MSEKKSIPEPSGESPVQRKRKSLKNLFSLSPKFQKSLQRYLCIFIFFYNFYCSKIFVLFLIQFNKPKHFSNSFCIGYQHYATFPFSHHED